MNKLDRATWYTFFAAILSYILVYGFELTHFTLSIDEENTDNVMATLTTGRWGHALLREFIFPEPYAPFFTLALALILMSFASVVICRYLRLDTLHAIFFSVLIAALPQLAYQFEFQNQAETVALAILSCAASMHFAGKGGIKNAAAFVALTIVTLSVYQSLFLIGASLICIRMAFDFYRNEITPKACFKQIALYIVLVGVSLVFNSLITKFLIALYHTSASSYLSAMIGWGKHDTHTIVHEVLYLIANYFSAPAPYGLRMFSVTLLAFVIIILASFWSGRRAFYITLFSLAALASPFILNVLLGSYLPPRTMTQLPAVFAGLITLAIMALRSKTLGIAVCAILLACGSAASNQLFYSDYMARASDEHAAKMMLDTIYQKYPQFDIDKNPVFFYGAYEPKNIWKLPRADTFGASFFRWDGGNNNRIYNYFKISNIADFLRPSPEQVDRAIADGTDMASWPNRNAVAMKQGVVIVKIGPVLSPYNR
ncbi:glucosyltransferase domain-containing protein [Nissabacter sp. SGAir0207]|uniref:glucosyltransferase domain-containing protein n=1 Tax=Nissabacter sp. SGAir0207 TaxID=2126321 RepID=UPI0010CD233F|nr:glucosyltransferase domain-containing protein [Nissabacter sp. SGAir0207]QCR35423.1 hypothetical protein C1N62_04660 [Nissabacter sp. SGAir0207]